MEKKIESTLKSKPVRRKKTTIENKFDPKTQISELAYKYFVDRGCVHGFDQQDWHRAEKEILGK